MGKPLVPGVLARVDRPRQQIAVAEPLDRSRSGGAIVDDPRPCALATAHPFHDITLELLQQACDSADRAPRFQSRKGACRASPRRYRQASSL